MVLGVSSRRPAKTNSNEGKHQQRHRLTSATCDSSGRSNVSPQLGYGTPE